MMEVEKNKIVSDIHIKWLSKAKTAVINGDEMTVLPYGFVQTIVKELLDTIFPN